MEVTSDSLSFEGERSPDPRRPSPPVMSESSREAVAQQFINVIAERIKLMLPVKTGATASEVEHDSQFTHMLDILITKNKCLDFVSMVLESLCSILNSIDYKEDDPRSVDSIYLVTRLLAKVLRYCWNRTVVMDHLKYEDYFYVNLSAFNYFDRPPPLSQRIVNFTIHSLIRVYSSRLVKRGLSYIKNAFIDTSSPDDNGEFNVDYVEKIDIYVEYILRYVSAANPTQYYEFYKAKIIKYSERDEMTPPRELQVYAPLLKFMFYNDKAYKSTIKTLIRVLMSVRSNSWKQLIISLFVFSIRDQFLCRPGDYIKFTKPDELWDSRHNALFDFIYSIFEYPENSATLSVIQAWLLMLCVEDFKSLESKPNKLKVAFNKRLKFAHQILSDSFDTSNLDSFKSLINIFHLGVRLRGDYEDHHVYRFSQIHLEKTFTTVNQLEIKHHGQDPNNQYIELFDNLYTAAIIFRPEKYARILSDMIYEFEGDVTAMKVFTKVIKELADSDLTRNVFYDLIDRIGVQLKPMVFGTVKVLDHYNELLESSSSVDSVISVKSSSESDSLGTEINVKSPLDHYMTKSYKFQHSNSYESSIQSQQSGYQTKTFVWVDKVKLMSEFEELLSNLMSIFKMAPTLYFQDPELIFNDRDRDMTLAQKAEKILKYNNETVIPLKYCFEPKTVKKNIVYFKAACNLAMTVVNQNGPLSGNRSALGAFSCFVASNYIIQAICDACTSIAVIDTNFKARFVFLNRFLSTRDGILPSSVHEGPLAAHNNCTSTLQAAEKCLLITLCATDAQFYNFSKITIKYYLKAYDDTPSLWELFPDNLYHTFAEMVDDGYVFTGMVSLQKRYRSILRNAKPTKSLFEAWIIMYYRWLGILEEDTIDNGTFRNISGFLVASSGCFVQYWTLHHVDNDCRARIDSFMNDFFNKCVSSLSSDNMLIATVMKDELCNESHPAVYHLIGERLIAKVNRYLETKTVNKESIMFVESLMTILTSMISNKNNGSFMLLSSMPNIVSFLLKFFSMMENSIDLMKFKLRFAKLQQSMQYDKRSAGLSGAYKLRNQYAKQISDWLEQSVFNAAPNEGDLVSHNSGSIHSELAYLNMDLAVECSKCLALQVDELLLEIPVGTKDENVRKYKDLAFSNYFSLFYKILQKYMTSKSSLGFIKSRFRVNTIVDNVLNSISSLLQYDNDVGLQFVLPLGYYGSNESRRIFLKVFAQTLSSRKSNTVRGVFSEDVIRTLSEIPEVYVYAATCASSTEQNLLATSLFYLFSYTRNLDSLFNYLLDFETMTVRNSSNIFRHNSTLTRLLSNFAKDYGLEYLSTTLKSFIQRLVANEVYFEVEKNNDTDLGDADLFISCLTELVDRIYESVSEIPLSFRYICGRIYDCVKLKFKDAALMAVGSFIFLRFFCPAIISPDLFFDTPVESPKVKRSLIQLVKVIQNMANGSLNLLKWPGLVSNSNRIGELNHKVFDFLKVISVNQDIPYYPFEAVSEKPIPELRFLHKYLYNQFVNIRYEMFVGSNANVSQLEHNIELFRKFDKVMNNLGQPKALLKLKGSPQVKDYFETNNTAYARLMEFMNNMSMKYVESTGDHSMIHNSIAPDGTPIVVLNLVESKDVELFIYKFFETASQVWENKFYVLFDFTEVFYSHSLNKSFVKMLVQYAPPQFPKNCARVYYFNLPRSGAGSVPSEVASFKKYREGSYARVLVHSILDSQEVVNGLRLSPNTLAIVKDTRVTFSDVEVYDLDYKSYIGASLRLGRRWLQICFTDSMTFTDSHSGDVQYRPVEIYKLTSITKCEVQKDSKEYKEFVIHFNEKSDNATVRIRSREASDILRLLYFTTTRRYKQTYKEKDLNFDHGPVPMHWFARLYNMTFHGILSPDDDVRTSASMLFSSLATYFDVDFNLTTQLSRSVAYPSNTTDYVATVSEYLAETYPSMSLRFFKAYFDYYDAIPDDLRVSAIKYISPWIKNIREHILSSDEHGPDRVAEIIRSFCRITSMNRELISCFNDMIWSSISSEPMLTSILVDEVVAFAADNKNDDSSWDFIVSVISTSAETCGEVTLRILTCVKNTSNTDSTIASQSKTFEIMVLVKIAATLFFNSYVCARSYLAEVFFIATLFIDNSRLNFGHDLQRLVLNTVHSFLKKPDLSEDEERVITKTLDHFSGQRARLLFGIQTERPMAFDAGHLYNRAINLELLCDTLNNFIAVLGVSSYTSGWRFRWCSNALDVAFSSSSIFKTKAMLIVCILARDGVNNSTASRTLASMSRADTSSLDKLTSLLLSYSRIYRGINRDAVFTRYLVWPHICFAMLNHIFLYQPAIECLINLVTMLVEGGNDYIHDIFAERATLEPFVSNFEEQNDVKITVDNFEFHLFDILAQGLTYPHLKQASLGCMKQYFTAKYKSSNDIGIRSNVFSDNPYAFLVYIYLASSQQEFEEYVRKQQFSPEMTKQAAGNEIPQVVIDFFLAGSEPAHLLLIYCSSSLSISSVDPSFKDRFLNVYFNIFTQNSKLSLLCYELLRTTLDDMLITTQSIDTVNTISNIHYAALSEDDFSFNQYREQEQKLKEKLKIKNIPARRKLYKPEDDENDVAFERIKSIISGLQEMVYRSSCSYLDGSTLED